jgi:hypothetical protein
VTGAAEDLSGARAYQGRPLPGSPAGRLQDAAAEILAAGTLPRCPHPDQPPLWYLPAGSLTCGPCTGALLLAADANPARCQICTAPATAIAAWVLGDVPCFSHLCEECRSIGFLPVVPN